MASHDKKPLWLISPRLDASQYRDRLIGSVVKYPDLPTERHIPYKKTTALPRDIVPSLDPPPVQVRNVRFWQSRIQDVSVSATLNEILEVFGERAREDSTERTATVARLWHMDSPGEQFKELLKDKGYFDELFELLQTAEGHQAYFVTDIVTLVNLEETDKTARGRGGGANVDLPLGLKAPGVQVGFSAAAGAKVNVRRERGHAGTYTDEVIVFLGYRRVRLERVLGRRGWLERTFLGESRGFTIRDGFDHWPEMTEKPVPGNARHPLGVRTPASEVDRQLGDVDVPERPDGGDVEEDEEMEAIVKELGFDVMVVGE